MRLYGFLCLLFLLGCTFSKKIQGQSSFSNIQHLGKEEGLIHDADNYFVSEDSQGFIWISSPNGFYRFDGLHLTHFLIPALQDNAFLPDQNIQSAFYEDDKSCLWFTSYNSLHSYNPKTNQIQSYQALDPNRNPINYSYHIFHINNHTNQLWLRAGEELWIYDINLRSWKDLFPDNGVRFAVVSDAKDQPQLFISCPWVNGPIKVWEKNQEGNWASNTYMGGDLGIRSALIENDSIAWLFSNRGLISFNFSQGKIVNKYTHTPRGIPLNLFAGYLDKDRNTLMLATLDRGLISLDLQHHTFTSNALGQLANNSPRAFFNSSIDQIWISHKNDGLYYTSSQTNPFKNYFFEEGEPIPQVDFLQEDKDKDIWQLTDKGEIYFFNQQNESQTQINISSDQPSFRHMGMDKEGRLIFITDDFVYQLIKKEPISQSSLEKILSPEKIIFSIFDGIEGRILLNTQEGIFDLREEEGKYFLNPSKEFEQYAGFKFTYLYPLSSRHFIAPFESRDLWLLQEEKQEWNLQHQWELGAHTYSGLLTRGEDSLWIGNTLGLFLAKGGKLENPLNKHKELQGLSIYGILPDAKKNLWLPTQAGLIRYHPPTDTWTKFTEADGTSSDQFSHYAHLTASDGKIWLGTQEGLCVFHPDSVEASLPIPKAYIEELWINNLPFELDTNINYLNTLSLDYFQHTLAFELVAIGFHEAQKNQLKYRLLGYDDKWVHISNGNFARFTKVPPGSYTLEIIPLNANNIEGGSKFLPIQIRPPFWQSMWFRILAILVGILLILLSFRLYYGRKLARQRRLLEKEKTLQSERNRIAKELHDDMGSSLSSILFLSEDLLFEPPKGKEHEIQRISSLAENSLENMQEIIWALDRDKNTLQDLSIHLRAFATELLSDHKISLAFENTTLPDVDYSLGSASRRNVYLIVKEALHNIIKHAAAKKVEIHVGVEAHQLSLSIADDGKGFELMQERKGGYGLNNMRSRAEDIGANLHIESNPEQGTVLSLLLPL